jgi:hypothetical protein
MAKIKTNIMELILREVLIGKEFYDNNNTIKRIDEVNYQPILDIVYVKSGDDGYYFSMNEFYDFELNQNPRPIITPNKGRIKVSDLK